MSEYIDATPTWRGLLPFLVERAAAGDRACMSELERLCDVADKDLPAANALIVELRQRLAEK